MVFRVQRAVAFISEIKLSVEDLVIPGLVEE